MTSMSCGASVCIGITIIRARQYSIRCVCMTPGVGGIVGAFMSASLGGMTRGIILCTTRSGFAERTTRQFTRAGGIRRMIRGGDIMDGVDITVMATVMAEDMVTAADRAVAVRRARLA
jgi:hypothetical protein